MLSAFIRSPASVRGVRPLNWSCSFSSGHPAKVVRDSTDQQSEEKTEESSPPKVDWNRLRFPSKVPQRPHLSEFDRKLRENPPPRVTVDEATVQLLERLSLVDLDSKEAHKTLEDSIEFASRILSIDTEGVKPLYTVLENQRLVLREDSVTDGNIREDVLANARISEEDYFVAPPGNIPLDQEGGSSKTNRD
ncbi:glutamyl-tRNA(Gln) amidotransferase subunit C, mitochondrial [Uranotaenia lowii]|uniref:glutamyl-tRNA(Gln) amidotransferase subunit C, mitochondrial n=1 Tax=Uranotaenia lowii TaxID=190385 RepID=UPI0024790433|nr:glutamyl-tRNA(Gln) amidotransferase subunit C, mitochondrial [Uranotaenia lowii]